MADYDNTDRGALFKNDKEGGNPNRPDYKGSINVGGTDYWLSAWLKTDRNGKKFMSLSVKLKDEVRHHEDRKNPGPPIENAYAKASAGSATRQSMASQAPAEFVDDDSDIPF